MTDVHGSQASGVNRATAAAVPRGVLIANGSWGVVSYVSQTLLVSLFFIILGRRYPTDEFARFMVASALIQMLSAFSALGLGQWFVREIASGQRREELVLKFLKAQIYSGIGFYLVNSALAALLYKDHQIRLIAAILGANIVFDNVINTLKCLNVADLQQRKTFVILTGDAAVKCAVGAALFLWPLSIVTLSLALLAVRVLTLNLFLKLGTSHVVNVMHVFGRHHTAFAEIRQLVTSNWPWIVLGGVSVVNWRAASIIISTQLSLADTAVYEICYRLFSPAQMLPVMAGTTIFPMFVRLYNSGEWTRFRTLYRQTYAYALLFGLVAFSFVYSFADVLIPAAFGQKYATASPYAIQMFLTMLIFPTAFLQGNILLAMKLERRDMWLNIVMLVLNLGLCLVGVHFVASLTVVTASLFISFAVFHLFQDVLLIRGGVSSVRTVIASHATTGVFVLGYSVLARLSSSHLAFPLCWCPALLVFLVLDRRVPGIRPYLTRAGVLSRS